MGELKKLRIAGTENTVTPYTAGEGIEISAGRQVSVDTDVVATKTDLNGKVDKVSGKGLSTNDFTNANKTKLDKTNITYCTCTTSAYTATKVVTIASGANTSFIQTVGAVIAVRFTYTNTATSPKLNVNGNGARPVRAKGALIGSAGLDYAGSASGTIIYMYDGSNWVFLGWDVDKDTTYSTATQSSNGLMSAADKTKLDGIETEANKTVVDDALDGESTNPVQNAVVTEALDGKADIGDLAPAYSTSGTYAVGDYVAYNGNIYRCTTAITTAEAWTAAHWTQVAIGDELSGTKADLSQLDDTAAVAETPDQTAADLYLSDENGNVIAQFADGEIETKNFDSSAAVVTKIQNTDATADLYVADEQGNGVLRVSDGNIQTSTFSTDQNEYKKTFAYNNTSGAVTLVRFFPSGSKVAFHLVQNNDKGSETIGNYKITYGYVDGNGTSHPIGQDYGYNYYNATIPEDAPAVYAAYGTTLLWGESGTLAFSVFSEANYPRQPKVVTVDASGGRDYTSVREAVDAVALYASDFTPYEIHIYPGTYNIMDDYTASEIAVSSFKGLIVTNGISLIGMGSRSEVILSAELSTTDYDSAKRNAVSTLNLKGNVRVENMTIHASNIRYAIHDDIASLKFKKNIRILRNLKLQGYNLTTGIYTYGAGGGNGKVIDAKNCDFTNAFHVHNTSNQTRPYFVYLEDCTAKRFTFSDYANVGEPTRVFMRNCKAPFIEVTEGAEGQTQTMYFDGEGTKDYMFSTPSGYLYNLGDCHRFDEAQIAKGYAVKFDTTANKVPSIATAINDIYGISLGIQDGCTIVQSSGYINSNILGLSGLAVGDYLTIDTSTGAVISGGTESNAIAKIKYVDSNSIAYAKLML